MDWMKIVSAVALGLMLIALVPRAKNVLSGTPKASRRAAGAGRDRVCGDINVSGVNPPRGLAPLRPQGGHATHVA